MKNRFMLSAAGATAAAIGGAATADITVTFDPTTLTGGEWTSIDLGQFSGVLTGITYEYTWANDTGDSSWASDMMFGISDGSYGVSMGGYNLSLFSMSGGPSVSSYGFAGGINGSPSDGTYSGSISTSYAMAGTGKAYLANGWNGSAGTTTSATITFEGLTAVPAPGALALLGLAGIAGTSRKRK